MTAQPMTASKCLVLALCLATTSAHQFAAAQGFKSPNQAPAARPPVSGAEPSRPEPQGADFYVLNATQVPIVSIQVSRPEETRWGANRLDVATLAPGARFLVELPKDGRCRYDVRMIFRGGNETEERNMDGCQTRELRLNVAGAPPANNQSAGGATAAPPSNTISVTIINAFRRPLSELRASPASATQWGADRLGQDMIASQAQWELRLPADQGCQYDLQARFDRASPQEIMKVNLCTTGTVRFEGPRPGTVFSYGTGFRISAAGHIMTNNHVVQSCGSVAVEAKGRHLPLRVAGQDPVADLAVLQQPDMVTPFLSFRSPQSPVRVAERAISIGYPIPEQLGDRVVTEGIVNALTGGKGDATQYQLQTPIQPGNSGGPIFDRNGLVIGVAVSGIDRSGTRIMQNVNFAVSPVVAARFAESLGVQLRYEPGNQELSTADVMDRNGDRVLQLVCLN